MGNVKMFPVWGWQERRKIACGLEKRGVLVGLGEREGMV
jgi:hypothetical protein